ncbi:phospholipase D-like domain-containing protein [Mammaliicoccus fleurettii]|uniref:NgoFVII family restriction endonuclease n=1 Tax=Mammaliicoccus fleurettii TaxID=150056 RepID=UPI002DB5A217|nr:NgoFVII family restriction endonuclease [Mammaliicoccus fleurettii]MEB8068156.1 hypothetical protein [Mammaliicoccus fleurettii]
MAIWNKYTNEQRKEYIRFLQVYGALSNLFRQKQGDAIPYLDSKFQETAYAKVFNAENVDIGNTPHDILSIFNNERIGIGLKTWMNTKPSYQKVMQLKKYKKELDNIYEEVGFEALVYKISEIKNNRLIQDYNRLGLEENKNIYHYVTRDEGKFVLQESSYPLIEINNITDIKEYKTSLTWSDGLKNYKYTFGDSQIWQRFSHDESDTTILDEFHIDIIDDPFEFLISAYSNMITDFEKEKENITVAYLPLYSYRSKKVELKSGLNQWNASSKNKGSDLLRPDKEIYIPIPIEFHRFSPNFFTDNILDKIEKRQKLKAINKGKSNKDKLELPEIRFIIVLPNGKEIPGLLTADNLKQFQSGGYLNNVEYGQSDLGNWLLVDVLKLKERQIVTKQWLNDKETDSVKLWYYNNDKRRIYIDFAPVGSFEKFMQGETPTEIDEKADEEI